MKKPKPSRLLRMVIAASVVGLIWLAILFSTPLQRSAAGSVCGGSNAHYQQAGSTNVRPRTPDHKSASPSLRDGSVWAGVAPPVAFFTSLKPMPAGGDPANVIRQRNAVASWKATHLGAEVFVFGDDTAHRFASELGVTYVPDVETTSSGVPVFDDMLKRTKELTKLTLLCFLNADIVFAGTTFNPAVESMCSVVPPTQQFLMIGRRFDIPLNDSLSFDTAVETAAELKEYETQPAAFLQNDLYKDYFIFSRDLWEEDDVPALAVGRARIDDWIVHSAAVGGAYVADLSPVATVYHQIHNYNHVKGGKQGAWAGEDAQRNFVLAGDVSILGDINRSPFQLRFDWSGDVAVYRSVGATCIKLLYDAGFFVMIRFMIAHALWFVLLLLVPGAAGLWWFWTRPTSSWTPHKES